MKHASSCVRASSILCAPRTILTLLLFFATALAPLPLAAQTPGIAKAFGAASIPLNGTTSLTFTLSNPNASPLTALQVSDTFPAGLVIATPNGLVNPCSAGFTATAGTSSVDFAVTTLAAGASCTFAVNVVGTSAGTKNNTVNASSGTNVVTSNASITVVAPPSITKVFNPSVIVPGATTSLTFTITNPAANSVALTGVAFNDTLPTGLTVANASATVCGGTLTTTAPTGIALSGATIAANSQCQFGITVTGAAAGNYTNTTGAVISTNGGTGNTATANLTVTAPPIANPVSATVAYDSSSNPITLNLSGGAATSVAVSSAPAHGTSSASGTTITYTPNTGYAGPDSFNYTATNASGTSAPATIAIAVFAPTINLTPASLPAGTVGTAYSQTVTASGGAAPYGYAVTSGSPPTGLTLSSSGTLSGTPTTGGAFTFTIRATDSSTGTGPFNGSRTYSITVTAPPTLSKVFGATSIPLGGTTSLTFTIANPNANATLTGIGFSDPLPSGLTVASPNGLIGSCGGGTITAVGDATSVSLGGATLAGSSSCTFAVNVRGIAGGVQNNVTSAITSTEGGTGGTAAATVTVLAPSIPAPMLNGWSLLLLVLAFVAIGVRLGYRRARTL